MERIKKILRSLFWAALGVFIIMCLEAKLSGKIDWIGVFHMAYYVPAIGLLAAVSGQIDLLTSIQTGGNVNLRARIYDFIHWLMLIGIAIGSWMVSGVTIWWFIIQLILLFIIGWQVGAGIRQRLRLTIKERVAGIIFGTVALITGLCAGYIRSIDKASLGWGWLFESSTAIIATVIVFNWIKNDLRTIRKSASGYPRSLFLKGLFSNFLVLWFWSHIMVNAGFDGTSWLRNLGLSFNVLVGNLIYLVYWLLYEHHRKLQKQYQK